MEFGLSTTILRDLSVTTALEVIAQAGFASAEIWIEHLWQSGETPEEIRRRAAELRLALTVHAPIVDLNLSSANRGIRRESRRQIEEALAIAARLDATIVTVHPGRLSSKLTVDACWELFLEAVAACDEIALREGLLVAFEGMEQRAKEYFITPAEIQRLFDHPWKATGLTVDLAHACTVMDPVAYLTQIPQAQVVHAHCSDQNAAKTHLPLGEGTVDVVLLLQMLGTWFSGRVVVEGAMPARGADIAPANAAYLRRHGFIL